MYGVNNLLLAVVGLGVVSVSATLAAVLDVANLAVLEAVKEGSLDVLLRDGLVSLLQDSLNVLTVVACTVSMSVIASFKCVFTHPCEEEKSRSRHHQRCSSRQQHQQSELQ